MPPASPTLRAAWLLGLLGLLLLGAVVLLWRAPERPDENPNARAMAGNAVRARDVPGVAPAPAPATAPDPARTTVLATTAEGFTDWPASREAAEGLRRADGDGGADLEIIQGVLGDYAQIFGAAPEGGSNAEFTRALLGDNPKRVRFLPPDLALISGEGELLDRWGTPYDFHKLSGRRIDLRSAGPDRALHTPDDLVAEGPGEAPPL